ncbi:MULTISPECIES: YesL family protein [Paenibacillus]|uniref:YesL family protein n=1 Tax=Paenibacillus TaxID=44249 RepID=UPI000470DD16|nr:MULTISPECIES: DUF624 domain-containing protein [Paenibacillus]ALP38423.1 hypothetical protein ASL14_21840 [Paenibacillus sp. IHB B 3084]MBE0337399.1 DUF624 domain-containing protein [Paenibacillus sp. 23TSA30-6]
MVRFVENMNKWCMRLLRLVYLNLLWTVATILGLGFIGVGPATVAMLSILRQWIRGNEEVAIFSTFVRYFRESFKEAAIIGAIYSLVGYVLYVDIVNVSSWYVRVVTLIGAFLYLISLAYIFPLLAHYDWKGIKLKIRMSVVIGFSYLQYTLVLFVAIVALFTLILGLYPGILTFAGASIIGYLVMWMTHQVFSKIEREVLVKEEDMA